MTLETYMSNDATIQTRMANIETQQALTQRDVQYIRTTMDTFIAAADSRYASKLTENLVYGASGIILIAVIGAIIAQVVKKK